MKPQKIIRIITKRSKPILVVGLVTVAGAGILVATRAAGPFLSLEAEQGVAVSPASVVVDASASGGSAIRFGGGTTPTITTTVTVNGADKKQTMDGFGIAANSASWNNGELKPAIDRFLSEQGSTLWRVIIDEEDWESANDNSDPNTFNWTYYNNLFTTPKFEELWATMAYLNSKGVNDDMILSFMGQGPSWMGGHNLNASAEDEWVETVAAVAYYAKTNRGLQFGKFSPNNEPDVQDVVEGVLMDATKTARVYGKLVRKLDTLGMSDLRIIGPDHSSVVGGIRDYAPAMFADSVLSARIDAISVHRYGGGIDDAASAINTFNSNYPGRKFWMSEFGRFEDFWPQVTRGPSGFMFWEGYDSVYNHAIRNGLGTDAPNDSFQPSLLSYNESNGTYSPNRDYYRLGQVYKWVPKGSRYVGSTSSRSNVSTRAFIHEANGHVTVVGWNQTSATQVVGGTLSGTPSVSVLRTYITSDSGTTNNMSRKSDVSVVDNEFIVSVPANSIFTVTNAP